MNEVRPRESDPISWVRTAPVASRIGTPVEEIKVNRPETHEITTDLVEDLSTSKVE